MLSHSLKLALILGLSLMAAMPSLAGTEPAATAADSPQPIHPDSLRWIKPPGFEGIEVAWVLGGEKMAGPYVLRVKLSPGARIAPHTHPDLRNTTVLKGTLYVGFGERLDEARLVAIPAGSVYVAPAGKPHFIWAKDGEVLYQENGVGPSGTAPIKQP